MKQSHSPSQPRLDVATSPSEAPDEVLPSCDTLASEPFDLVLPIVNPSDYCQLPAYIGSVPTARFVPHFLRKLASRSAAPSKPERSVAYTLFKELTPCIPAQERDHYFALLASSFGLEAASTDIVTSTTGNAAPSTGAAALRCYTNMDFSDALYALKAQLFVARRGWGGGRWLGLKRGDPFLGQFFYVETVTGPRSAYAAPQEDLLACDWYVL